MTDTPADASRRPRILTQADLEATWRRLMEPLGFSRRSLWLLMIGADDEAVPQVVEVEGADDVPSRDEAAQFAEFVAELRGDLFPGGRLAILRARPGRDPVRADDLGWARALVTACRDAGVPTDVVHLATDVDLVPLPYDTLAVA